MLHSNFARTALGTACLAAAMVLTACGNGSEQELLNSAKAYLEKDDPKAAVIQLKTALQKNGQNAEGRYLLGKALLGVSDPVSAQVELQKARELKYDNDKVLPALAHAMLLMGEHRKLVEQFSEAPLQDKTAIADLKTTVGSAFAALNEREKAQEFVKQAQQAQPGYAPALILNARLKAAADDFEGALFVLDEVLAKDPANEFALIFKGEILVVARKDEEGALQAWRTAVKAHPKSLPAHVSIIGMLLRRNEVAPAKAQLAELVKVYPNHLETKFFQAQMAYLDKDDKAVGELTAQILKVTPDNVLVLQLAGASEYRQKSLVQAEGHLGRALKLAPDLPLARQLLAQTYLRTGQPHKTLEVLKPLLEQPKVDAGTLGLAGEAYLQTGNLAESERAFTAASKANPNDSRSRTALALGQLSKGNADRGFAELENIAAADKGPRADLALIAARMRKNDTDGALKAIDALQKKLPDKPLAYFLRGRVLALRKDTASATTSYEKALSVDPQYFPAAAGLAALDLAAGKPEQAKKRFDDLLRTDPKNYQAMIALADLKSRSGGSPAEVNQLISEAIKLNPQEPAPRLLLIRQLMATGQAKPALAAAQDAAAALPNNFEIMDMLGQTQLAAGDAQQAVSSFKKLAALQPTRPQPQLRLADAYMAAKDEDSARLALKRALEITPNLVQAQRGLIMLALRDRKPQDAVTLAREVQKQRPGEALGWLFEGDIESERKNWDGAVALYRTALQKAKTTEVATKLHGALVAGGKRAEAERFAASWEKENPSDGGFLFYLGDAALAQRDFAAAEERYRAVAKVQPKNALALNNIAWLMVRQGKEGALQFAEQANQLMPDRPPLMDTLASALAAAGQLPKAIDVQKRALERAPDDAAMRLNLAKLYIKTGDKSKARTELEQLGKLGDKFPGQPEVTDLLKTL